MGSFTLKELALIYKVIDLYETNDNKEIKLLV